MNIYYWCPFFTKVATEKAVINSLLSIKKYSKNKIKINLIDTIGEWRSNPLVKNFNLDVINLNKYEIIKYLPKFGFFKSRLSYIIVFLISIRNLHSNLRKNNPKYLVIHLMTFIPLVLLFFFNYKTKFILRISGLPKLNFIRKFFWKLVGKKIYKITTPTKLTLNSLKENNIFEKDKLIYLPDPIINISTISKKFKKKDHTKKNKFIAIGRLTSQKNFNFLIKAFKIIIQKYPESRLSILGDGEDKNKLKKQIHDSLLQDKVFLLGYRENIFQYLAEADIFILSSLWEDPGFVLVEAGYMEKIILSSDCPNGPKELLDEGKNGFLFKSNSTEDLFLNYEKIYNTSEEEIFNKKLLFKRKIKEFTLLNHFKILNQIFYE